jgi:hypothetical protein
MTKPRLTVTAYPDVAGLAAERRAREQSDPTECVMFIGFSTREPETPPPAAPQRRPRANWLRAMGGWARKALPPVLGPPGRSF